MSEVTAKNAETFIDSDKVVIVGFFGGADSAEYKTLAAVADKLRDEFVFGATVDADVISKYGVKAPALIVFKKFDEGKNVFEGAWAAEDVTKFVTTSATPLMDELGPDNYSKYVETGVPLAYLFYGTEEQRKEGIAAVESIAKEHKGKLNFVSIDGSKYGAHGKNLGLDEVWPAFVIQVRHSVCLVPDLILISLAPL
jgi:protein disulfide-isomerase A1